MTDTAEQHRTRNPFALLWAYVAAAGSDGTDTDRPRRVRKPRTRTAKREYIGRHRKADTA